MVVKVVEADFPLVARNSQLVPTVIDHIQRRGFSVLGVDSEPWRGLSFLHVSTQSGVAERGKADEDPWATVIGSEEATGGELLTGEVGAFRVLKKWGNRTQVGLPFGPSFGLEDAKQAVAQYIEQPTDVRLWGRGLALDLASQHQSGVLGFDNWDEAMGCTSRAFASHGLSEDQGLACYESLKEAKRVVIDMIDQIGPAFDKWASDDSFALSAYVTHQVAYLRFGALGLIDTIDL